LKRLAVFDVDGTLLDSRRIIAESMSEAFTALDLVPPIYEETRKVVGLSLVPAMQRLAPDLPPSRYGALGEAYKDAFMRLRAEGQENLFDGAHECVLNLKQEGWLLGIATGKARRGVDKFIELHAFADVFDAAFCADDGPGKPHPHMLQRNMQTTGIEAAHTVMIGDTSFDMEMARAAGAYALGVGWGFHTPSEVEKGGAHHTAEDFAGLAAHLAQWRAGAL
jgi:phosphoglycolate phosphatase